ncbi:uncharacterized protein Z518_02313 [Rhinocladiella mackenziei CBS 650.93]|uniref:Calcineurin-like phosphoesterase domain-containing protein n=1 Tax=Rhinocladiella mackenziei CBS 650.93 TaxID=1442369 RepID=A0A0D2JEP1_9EURO|nr:uncharacterized protein Z518_02313 [Rhinocladiella mackenziei CBS 650.93]KIX07660.1 hypothetical protein Z518_02313 [Rhinocladiella mackenziei CBS 650.93]
MYISGLADKLLRLLFPIALCLTAYLYLYPAFHGCVFPAKDASTVTAFIETVAQHWGSFRGSHASHGPSRIPFRLLVLADPQLEGDSSLPKPEDGFIPKLGRHWTRLRATESQEIFLNILLTAREIWLHDFPEALQALRKRLDLFGNDHYLGHVYRVLHWWTMPTHVTVLGDLIGSQWVTDEEFDWRGWRFWNRVFGKGQKVENEIWTMENKEEEKIFDMNDTSWTNNIINIAGNHDVGYAGDISRHRMERFERVFGRANWDVRFQYPRTNGTLTGQETSVPPSLHLIVLNSLILDTPALSEDLQAETYDYLNGLISHRLRPVEDHSSFTLLLTHLPLHKKKGICTDAPFFDYWGNDDGGGVYKPRGLKEQNHLSEYVSHQGTLEALFGMSGNLDAPAHGQGRHGLILTGHDHEGCDVWHFIPSDSVWSGSSQDIEEDRKTKWDTVRWKEANGSDSHTGLRELTLRSMMGDYGGNAGLLSAWFEFETGEWKYNVHMCGLNLKVWWAVHVVDLVAIGFLLFSLVRSSLIAITSQPAESKHGSSTKKTNTPGRQTKSLVD